MHKIAVIRGDGIGIEVVDSTLQVLEQLPIDFEFVDAEAGFACYEKNGTSIPEETIESVRECGTSLFGAVTTPPGIPNYQSAILTLRQELDLYANIRPMRSFTDDLDFLIVRENTEGLYARIETRETDRATATRIITRQATERIMRMSIQHALQRNNQITIVHKANILRESDGLFREVCLEVAEEFPEIKVNEMLVDAAAMNLIRDPRQFDVIVTTNLFGDILSDEASQIVGGIGLAPSGNIGEKYALFEPVHGSAPDIAGQGIANPTACLRSAVMMLEHIGEQEQADQLDNAISHAVQTNPTKDLGGTATTQSFTNTVLNHLNRGNESEQIMEVAQ